MSDLVKAAGKENVFTDATRLALYSRGSIDRYSSMPEVAIMARNSSQISGVMKVAYKNSIPVVVRGGGSSPTGAVVPDRGGIVLDMKPMDSIHVSVENGYVEAEGGATLSNVDSMCLKHGFFFPPDPSSVSVATVGGAINENSGGMRCARFGVVKDWVLKVEVVLPDGTVTSFGEPTYKNRAGYNLAGLIVGSEGTLCIVTKAYLKIMPLPDRLVRIAAFFDRLEDAGESIFRIRKEGVNPFILEFADSEGIKAANEIKGWNYPESKGGMVLVDLDIMGKDEKSRTERVRKIFDDNSASLVVEPDTDQERDNLFEIRRIAFAAPGKLFSGFIDGDIVVPLGRIKDAIVEVDRIRQKYGVYIATCGHVGDGNLHPQIGADINNTESWRKAEEASNEINRLAISMGGSISGEHGIGTQKEKLLREQLSARGQNETLVLMAQIKRAFDPRNIMNPGKFGVGSDKVK